MEGEERREGGEGRRKEREGGGRRKEEEGGRREEGEEGRPPNGVGRRAGLLLIGISYKKIWTGMTPGRGSKQ